MCEEVKPTLTLPAQEWGQGEADAEHSRNRTRKAEPARGRPVSTHLREGSDPVSHVWENGGLVAHLKIKVDGLVREGGKLITEAKLVNALDLSLVGEAVILLLGLPVDGVPQGVLHIAVDIVVASGDDLQPQRHPQSAVAGGAATGMKCQPDTVIRLDKLGFFRVTGTAF